MNTVCVSETRTMEYLRDMGVFSTEMMCAEEGCDKLMKSDLDCMRWRCYSNYCRKELPIRGENSFFQYKESSGRGHARLKVNEILDLVYMFLFTRGTAREVAYTTGHSQTTVIDWYNMIREVGTHSVENAPKMVGTATNPVQMDESSFSGGRKYGRGRLMRGNLDENNLAQAYQEEVLDWNPEAHPTHSMLMIRHGVRMSVFM